MKVYISEVWGEFGYRAGEVVECKSMRGAKVAAERRRFFQGTSMLIESADRLHLLARKCGGEWQTF